MGHKLVLIHDRSWRLVPMCQFGTCGRIVMVVSFCDSLSVRDGLRIYFWRWYGMWWKCGWIVPIGMDRDDPLQPWRMVPVCDRLSACKSLRCYGVWWKCGRIVPIGTDRDDPSQPWRMVRFRDHLSVCKRQHSGVRPQLALHHIGIVTAVTIRIWLVCGCYTTIILDVS